MSATSVTSWNPQLLISLARLRSRAVLALDISADSAVSGKDIRRMDAAAEELFGVSLARIEPFPRAPTPFDTQWLPETFCGMLTVAGAESLATFLQDLHRRTEKCLHSDMP
jgi:hypothetical protein